MRISNIPFSYILRTVDIGGMHRVPAERPRSARMHGDIRPCNGGEYAKGVCGGLFE